ncbi:GAF domain-containing protein [Geodermatophilus sp. SYSU D00815]
MDTALPARQAALIDELGLLDDVVADDPQLRALVHEAAVATGMAQATINLLHGPSQCQIATHGFTGGDTPREDSLCAQVTGWEPDVYAFTDLTTETGFIGNPWVDGRLGHVRAYASAPLVVAGTIVGTLCVFDEEPRSLSLDQCDRLAALATAVVDLFTRRLAATPA